ncbi:extracellular solute-binding protein [Streptomyces sp. SID7804]|uniref:Sugar ABC transporter substrate-binding protein n=1 Tax=Streptomyces calvus TaxID=67282 RepID=A0A514JJI9_9ACTN|nr:MULTISPECIES: sugar ABC transporter substrate-binding protein [Streptomyces]MBA8976550.1 multiple sugar transport system substrate-binding protein [Streptomyces calvus]MYS31066.1 extracellular solute-binding protein [Streptomyces sp. SID7804]QDI67480.1 sugar ABC transporter substrate-binding protein [Streptomyces calvus]
MPGRHPRRSVLAAMAAVPLTGALGACSEGADTPSRGTTRAGKATRITFWSALRGSQEVVDAFNRTHDRIQVDFQQIPSGGQGGYAKLSNAARAGNAPDVATIEYPQVPGFAIDGVALDITDLVDASLRRKLLPQAFDLTTFQGRTYSVPLDVEPMVMHYRTDLFERYRLDVPRTWEEFADLAAAVRRKASDRRLVLFPTDGATQFAAYSWQAGAQWFDIRDGAWNVSLADAPTRRVAGYWQDLIDRDDIFVNAVESRQSDAQIGNGLVLTRLSGAWDAGAQMNARPGQRNQWRIAPLPQWDPARPAVGTHGGSTFAVTKDSRHPEAAMEFIAWQVSHPDALRARLSSGTSSQYPAASDLVAVGRDAFDRSYYGGQDIYALFRQEAEKIRDGWVWGPRMTATGKVMQDSFARAGAGRGTLIDSVRAAEDGTMPDLKALGLSTSRHST